MKFQHSKLKRINLSKEIDPTEIQSTLFKVLCQVFDNVKAKMTSYRRRFSFVRVGKKIVNFSYCT